MKISFCGVGKISFIAEDKTYVGDIMFQVADETLPEMQRSSGLDLNILVRLEGDPSWPFETVQEKLLVKARSILSLASKQLTVLQWDRSQHTIREPILKQTLRAPLNFLGRKASGSKCLSSTFRSPFRGGHAAHVPCAAR